MLRSLLLIKYHPSPFSGGNIAYDSYTWNFKELITLLSLRDGLVEDEFKPMSTGSMETVLSTKILSPLGDLLKGFQG